MNERSTTRNRRSLLRLGAAASAAITWCGALPLASAAASAPARVNSSCAVVPAFRSDEKTPTDHQRRRSRAPIPPMDAAAPARVETATFSLG